MFDSDDHYKPAPADGNGRKACALRGCPRLPDDRLQHCQILSKALFEHGMKFYGSFEVAAIK